MQKKSTVTCWQQLALDQEMTFKNTIAVELKWVKLYGNENAVFVGPM